MGKQTGFWANFIVTTWLNVLLVFDLHYYAALNHGKLNEVLSFMVGKYIIKLPSQNFLTTSGSTKEKGLSLSKLNTLDFSLVLSYLC